MSIFPAPHRAFFFQINPQVHWPDSPVRRTHAQAQEERLRAEAEQQLNEGARRGCMTDVSTRAEKDMERHREVDVFGVVWVNAAAH